MGFFNEMASLNHMTIERTSNKGYTSDIEWI